MREEENLELNHLKLPNQRQVAGFLAEAISWDWNGHEPHGAGHSHPCTEPPWWTASVPKATAAMLTRVWSQLLCYLLDMAPVSLKGSCARGT